MKDYDRIIKKCTDCLNKLEIFDKEDENTSGTNSNSLVGVSSDCITRTIKEHKLFVDKCKKSNVDSNSFITFHSGEILRVLPPVWDENLIGDYVEQVVDHFLESSSITRKKNSKSINKYLAQKKDESILVTDEDFSHEVSIKWKKVPQEDKKTIEHRSEKSKIKFLKDLEEKVVPCTAETIKKLEVKKEDKSTKLKEQTTNRKRIPNKVQVEKKKRIGKKENISDKGVKPIVKNVSPKVVTTDAKSYKARHMRFLGRTSNKAVDFSKEHPNLVLTNFSNAEQTLFPRRLEKSNIIEEFRTEKKEEEKEGKLKEATPIENEVETVHSTTTWHDLLSQKIQTVLSQRKILKYSRKNDKNSDKILEVNKDTQRIYDVIYDSPRCKKSNDKGYSNKLSVQNMPILCIRGECRVQKLVNISIDDELEKRDSDSELSNIRYYQFSHLKQNIEKKTVEDRKSPKDVEIQVGKDDDLLFTKKIDLNLKDSQNLETTFNKYKAPFQPAKTITQSTTKPNMEEQRTLLFPICDPSNRVAAATTVEEEELQRSFSEKLNRSTSNSSSASLNSDYSQSFENSDNSKSSNDSKKINSNSLGKPVGKTFVITSSNYDDNNSLSSRTSDKKRNEDMKNVSSRISSPIISVEQNQRRTNAKLNKEQVKNQIRTDNGKHSAEEIRLIESSAQTDDVKFLSPRTNYLYPSITVESDNIECSITSFEDGKKWRKYNEENLTSSHLIEPEFQCETNTHSIKKKKKETFTRNEAVKNSVVESKTDKTFIVNTTKETKVPQGQSMEYGTMCNINSDYKCDAINKASNDNNYSGGDETSNISISVESNQENGKRTVKGNENEETVFASSENTKSRLCVPKRFYNEKNKRKSQERQRQANYHVDDNEDATNKFNLSLDESSLHITTSSSGVENDNYKMQRCICSYHRQYKNNSNTSIRDEQILNESEHFNLGKSSKKNNVSQHESINKNIISDLDETSNSRKTFNTISRENIHENYAATRDELKRSYYRSQILLNNSLDLSPKFSNTLNKIYSGATKKSLIESKRTDPEVKRAVEKFLKSLSLNSNRLHFEDKNRKIFRKKNSNMILLEENACLRKFHNLISKDDDDDDDDNDHNNDNIGNGNENFNVKVNDRTIIADEQNRFHFKVPNILSESNQVSDENSDSFAVRLKTRLLQKTISSGTSLTASDKSNNTSYIFTKGNLLSKRTEGHKIQDDNVLISHECTSLSEGEILSLGEVKNMK